MAKKSAKRATKKSGKSVKRASTKRGAKGKAKAASVAAAGMFPVNTGKGASPIEVGSAIVAMFNQGKLQEIEQQFWSPGIVSCEGLGVNLEWRGRAAVEGKNQDWMKEHRLHGASAEGPFVGSTGFAIKFRMDVETISTGQRQVMEEVGVYTLRNGKIEREEFMYSAV